MGNTGSFSIIKMGEINVMDTIWYENPSKSEVIGSCGGDELSKAQHLENYQKHNN